MAAQRVVARQSAAPDRRPAAAPARVSVAQPSPHSAQLLQRRLGNQGAAALVAGSQRSQDELERIKQREPGRTQRAALNVSSPNDAGEREASATATRIMRMAAPTGTVQRQTATAMLQRKPLGTGSAPPSVSAEIQSSMSEGTPLPERVRQFMEPRLRADLKGVKVHTGEKAAKLSAQVNAKAFTVRNHIFFGKDAFHPETDEGKELIAHELVHTIQQGAAQQKETVQRSEDVTVTQHSAPQVQRWGLGDGLSFIANKANIIPGFRLFTLILGVNPINMSRVERSAANILRALIEVMPGGGLITQALDNSGVFEKVGAWVEKQVATLGMTGSAIKQALTTFLDSLSWKDVLHLDDVWERAKRLFTEPIERIKNFASGLVNGIIQFVKDAILMPLAALAEGTPAWDLLVGVLGKNPITGAPAPPGSSLIGGFMKLIGQQEIYENMQKSGAVGRAWSWFQSALAAVRGFVSEIPTLAINTFKALELVDIVLVPRAFKKVAAVFGNFFGRFFDWAGTAMWNLLEIIFDVVSPAALKYIKKTGAALKSILKNPLPFVGNLVKAAKLGFQNFGANVGAHLKAGLIDWLTGSLPGVYIPKSFALGEIVKFVFSVLGLTWQNVRGKLVKVLGETAVKAMETGFDIVVTLVTKGPAAAWEQIKGELGKLQDMVIGAITDFVIDTVVKKAIPKLISMFIPGAGFISAIISIYDTVMVFVQKISQIIQVVTGFIDSIVAIAAGAIGPAAAKVESILARLLSLAINFFAAFVGLGKVADKIMGVINKVRSFIDKALDKLVAWIVTMARKLFAKIFSKDKKDERTDAQKLADLDKAIAEAEAAMAKQDADQDSVRAVLKGIKSKYRLTSIELVKLADTQGKETDQVVAEINPKKSSKPKAFFTKMPECKVQFTRKSYDETEYRRQLRMAQQAIWTMKIKKWIENREAFVERRDKTGSGRDEKSRQYQQEYRQQVQQGWIAKRTSELMKGPGKMSGPDAAKQAARDWEKQAALHPLDQVAGGGPKPTGMGDSAINSSIGSSWRTQVPGIYTVANQISDKNQAKWNMNVTILLDGSAV